MIELEVKALRAAAGEAAAVALGGGKDTAAVLGNVLIDADADGMRLSATDMDLLVERHVDVVVQNHDEPGLCGEIEDSIESGIGEARRVAGHLRRHELFVNRELA